MENAFRKAITEVRQGWMKRKFSDGQKVCAVGALAVVTGHTLNELTDRDIDFTDLAEDENLVPLVATTDEIVAEQYPDRLRFKSSSVRLNNWGVITAIFNDHDDTTVEDVILVFEKAAVRENLDQQPLS